MDSSYNITSYTNANGMSIAKQTYKRLFILSLSIGFLLRLFLSFTVIDDLSFFSIIKLLALGVINDVCLTTIVSFFIWLDLVSISNSKYNKPIGYIWFVLFLGLLIYVSFFNTIFHEYGNVVPDIAQYFFLFKTISFGLRLFIPRIRSNWSFTIYTLMMFIYSTILVMFVAMGEYLFWDEFGVRYNFIAVDYLIYTNEVIGNIAESYPIGWIMSFVIILSIIFTIWITKGTKKAFNNPMSLVEKIKFSLVYFLLAGTSIEVLKFMTKFQTTENVYYNELQANGGYKFYQAFMSSSLDYTNFYLLLDKNEALQIINQQYNSNGLENLQIITDTIPEIRKNIVLITIESLSASFMERYGNTEGITPNLDRIAKESLVFNNLFAVGNRTVRGLEAVTLSRPPSAGESIVKQEDNQNLFSTGNVLKNKGYNVQYLYGGDSYFDNMKSFFGGNSYTIIDKGNFNNDEITFSNIWGVCDEDMFNKAIKVFDENAQSEGPFFGHIMTVSNHRPYTYPEGKIDISSQSQSRNGGVKYTDYAIGQFFEIAKTKSWFKDTVFVIISDHCASSAGKASLPLEHYHIPAMIYAPGFIAPKEENRLVSQIDVMPTLFGSLHLSYESKFYGQNIYKPNYQERAFIATYQNLGYLENDILTVLSPNRKVEQFNLKKEADGSFNMQPKTSLNKALVNKAVANYQISSLSR